MGRERKANAGWRQVSVQERRCNAVSIYGLLAGDSSVGRASDCRSRSYQIVPGSIPGRRRLASSPHRKRHGDEKETEKKEKEEGKGEGRKEKKKRA